MLGDKLKKLRTQKNVTQDDMGALLKVKRQPYGAYERNLSLPDIPSLISIAAYFGVNIEYLISDEIRENANAISLLPKNQELLEATLNLPDEDLKKIIEYAELLK